MRATFVHGATCRFGGGGGGGTGGGRLGGGDPRERHPHLARRLALRRAVLEGRRHLLGVADPLAAEEADGDRPERHRRLAEAVVNARDAVVLVGADGERGVRENAERAAELERLVPGDAADLEALSRHLRLLLDAAELELHEGLRQAGAQPVRAVDGDDERAALTRLRRRQQRARRRRHDGREHCELRATLAATL